jgi:hypothetical protein
MGMRGALVCRLFGSFLAQYRDMPSSYGKVDVGDEEARIFLANMP